MIRQKAHHRAGLIWISGRLGAEAADRGAALKSLLMLLTLAMDNNLNPLTEGVDHGHANAVQTAGHLVATRAEFAAGMEHGQHRLEGAASGARVNIGGNAAAVVGDAGGAIGVDHHQDRVAMAGQGLIHSVVHHLVDEMVQAAGTGGADVHAGPLAHRFQALKHLDLFGAVGGLDFGGVAHSERAPQGTGSGRRNPGADRGAGSMAQRAQKPLHKGNLTTATPQRHPGAAPSRFARGVDPPHRRDAPGDEAARTVPAQPHERGWPITANDQRRLHRPCSHHLPSPSDPLQPVGQQGLASPATDEPTLCQPDRLKGFSAVRGGRRSARKISCSGPGQRPSPRPRGAPPQANAQKRSS